VRGPTAEVASSKRGRGALGEELLLCDGEPADTWRRVAL
jgi:hypothetical protein